MLSIVVAVEEVQVQVFAVDQLEVEMVLALALGLMEQVVEDPVAVVVLLEVLLVCHLRCQSQV